MSDTLSNNVEDEPEYKGAPFLLFFKKYWKFIFTIFWPVVTMPVVLCINTPEARCGYVILIMAGYWVTECIPLGITSLIPVVLFPMLSIMDSENTCKCYMNDTIMVFIGGICMALAIEHCNLHMRIAIGVMKVVGCSHQRLLAGLIFVTTFVSMWISNTAATAMMIPIIVAILQELEKEGLGKMYNVKEDPEDPSREPLKKPTDVTKAYFMTTAYAATFGGTGTLVGTGTNLTFKGIFETMFPKAEGISFMQWMIWSFPQMILNSLLTWIYMQIFYLGLFRPNSKEAKEARIGTEGVRVANNVMKEKWKNLGSMTFHETAVGVLFLLLVALWIFRKPGFVAGWPELLTSLNLKDSAPVILIVILMFIIPKDLSFLYSCSSDNNRRPKMSTDALINWKLLATKMPWNLMFLLGSGFAISKGSNESCLSVRLGESLRPLKDYSPIFLLFVVCLFVGTITEFTSNVGVSNIVLPVIAQMSVSIKLHPLFLMIPATMSSSFAFRLPVGTPPNAIITGTGHIPTRTLIVGGCIPSIYSLLVILIMFPTWGSYIYQTNTFPDWALETADNQNGTSRCS